MKSLFRVVSCFLAFNLSCVITDKVTDSVSTTGSIVTYQEKQGDVRYYAKNCLESIILDISNGQGEYLDALAIMYGYSPQNISQFHNLVQTNSHEILSLELNHNQLIDYLNAKVTI